MPTLPDLAALLYFADLRQLSLSARLTWHEDHAVLRKLMAAHLREPPAGFPARFPMPQMEDDTFPIRVIDREWRVLLAPGGRYRVETPDGEAWFVSDGEARWSRMAGETQALAGRHRRLSSEDADMPGMLSDADLRTLLAPRWLLACCELRLAGDPGDSGAVLIGGRRAWRVTGVPRRVYVRDIPGRDRLLDRVDAAADAELGILLRAERIFDGASLSVAELHDVVLSPPQAAGPERFRIPEGTVPGEGRFARGPARGSAGRDPADDDLDDHDPDDLEPDDLGSEDAGTGSGEPADAGSGGTGTAGRGAQAAETAAHLAAAAMGFAARHAPGSRPPRDQADAEAAMPASAADGPPPAADRAPASLALIALLARAGLPAVALAAEFHQWLEPGAGIGAFRELSSRLPHVADGIFGPDALWDGLAGRADLNVTVHRVAGLRAVLPDRHRLDYRSAAWRTRATALACDGTASRRLFADRVAVRAAAPPRSEVGRLLEPAWLLDGWDLAEAGSAEVAGRPGVRVVAERAAGRGDVSGERTLLGATIAEAVVDAELGILLRCTSWAAGRPLERSELRDVIPGDPAPGELSREVFTPGAGLREVADSVGPLRDRDLPGPVQAAGTAAVLVAGGAIAGAVAVTGWLDKRRARRKSP